MDRLAIATMASPASSQPNGVDGVWKSAYDSLDDGLRASIAGARTGKNDILAAVLKTAGEKREICIRKQWKVKLPSGEVIVIRDVVEKIAKWVNAFIAVGDVAVQYDPATAALPWAAIRFVLQAAISDTQIEGAVVTNLEVISRLIARYRDFEKIHHDSKSSVASRINEGLTRLYVDVLKFLAIAVRHFDTHGFGRFFTPGLLLQNANFASSRNQECLSNTGRVPHGEHYPERSRATQDRRLFG